jgi:flagellar hook-associated protein FlgK
MINNFMGIEILSRGLLAQQLNQTVIASNMAKTYRDEYGYVTSSRQRVDVTTAYPFFLGNAAGVHALGNGPQVQQITRMRSMYLDFRIQLQSQTVGRNEVLMDVLSQVQGILTGSATIDDSLAELAGSFAALAADPLDVALRDDVVNAGRGFADLARQQFFELEQLQVGVNRDLVQTVADINQLLSELHSINKQLIAAPAYNVNDLLDARDYALTRLSRLLNVQSSFDSKGIANVFLGGNVLVNSAGFAVFDTNLINDHNVPLADVRLQSIAGFMSDVTTLITGGRLGGQLQARDVVLDFYKSSLDQCVHSILDVTNTMHRAGYAADGTTTNISFFTGVSARDININASMVSDPTRALVAASSRYGDTSNGQMAAFLGNIANLQADDFMRSQPRIRNFAGNIDPTLAMNNATTSGLNGSGSNSTNFSTPFLAGGGTFMINSVNVTYTATDSLYDVIDKINAADPNVQCFFNYTEQRIYILSNNTSTITDVTFGASGFTMLQNFLTSTIRMNNGFSPEDLKINPNLALNSATNQQAFKVTPGATFTFQVNGLTFSFTDLQSLNNVMSTLNSPVLGALFNTQTQEVQLNSRTPIRIIDLFGNFTTFTGLNGSKRIGQMTDALDDKVNSQFSSVKLEYTQSVNALEQLNNAQALNSAIAYDASEVGTPYEAEVASATKALIAYNAMLQVLHLIDKMLSDLVGIVGGASSSTFGLRE